MGSASTNTDTENTFGKDHGLIHEAVVTSRGAGWSREDWGAFAHDQALQKDVLKQIRNKRTMAAQSSLDMRRIVLNRKVRASCPTFVGLPVHANLEEAGTEGYLLNEVERWFATDQAKPSPVHGLLVYEGLIRRNLLERSLSSADGAAICHKPAALYIQLFGRDQLFLWRSISVSDCGLVVPYLRVSNDGTLSWIEMKWVRVETISLDSNSPAALLPA